MITGNDDNVSSKRFRKLQKETNYKIALELRKISTQVCFGVKDENDYEDIHCPVCGFDCLGNGGLMCVDKPALIKDSKEYKEETFNA